MMELADALKAKPGGRAGALPGAAAPMSRKTFTMQALRRATLWGATAAAALLAAVLTSRSGPGVERIALVLHRPQQLAAAPPAFDAKTETERLAGSISKQIKAATETRHVDEGPSVAATAALTASMDVPVAIAPQDAAAAPVLAPIMTPVPEAPPRTEYGVDIGSGLTVQALRLRWAAMRTAHPDLFAALEPLINVRDIPRSNRIELRLIVGPIADPAAAAELCATMARMRLFCQPTVFDGQHLAQR